MDMQIGYHHSGLGNKTWGCTPSKSLGSIRGTSSEGSHTCRPWRERERKREKGRRSSQAPSSLYHRLEERQLTEMKGASRGKL
ncbi:hypothetical protein LIA77_05082 [Sarocladium implicatum]|nr:hypothetical protein LIA77_05082 [Sarocladium implicatum]